MGGFLFLAAAGRRGLHRRIAHAAVRAIGTASSQLVLGFMVASGFLSTWISNTATVDALLPYAG